eukprot:6177965-Pleurochrysis_carterae.AAC.1
MLLDPQSKSDSECRGPVGRGRTRHDRGGLVARERGVERTKGRPLCIFLGALWRALLRRSERACQEQRLSVCESERGFASRCRRRVCAEAQVRSPVGMGCVLACADDSVATSGVRSGVRS